MPGQGRSIGIGKLSQETRKRELPAMVPQYHVSSRTSGKIHDIYCVGVTCRQKVRYMSGFREMARKAILQWRGGC